MSTISLHYPILVVSYTDTIREALMDSLRKSGVEAIPCSDFHEAEDVAVGGVFNGILVDLQTIVKAKGDEKIAACSLTGFYPTLRVRTIGSMLIPMAMPGDAKQDSSLNDFLIKTCAAFTPRMMRLYKRRDICSPVTVSGERAVTLNLSWGGLFLATLIPEIYKPLESLILSFNEFEIEVPATVRWVQQWGERRMPGLGVSFDKVEENLESVLANVLQHDKTNARDRMIAR